MELTTSWKEEGRQEGRHQGEVNLVLRQLRRRCGQLDSTVETQVNGLPTEQLESLAEALRD